MIRVLACSLVLSACTLVPMTPRQPGTPDPQLAAAPPVSTTVASAAPTCPTDMSIDPGAAKISTIQADGHHGRYAYHGRYASAHKQPLTSAFGVPPEIAIGRVIAIENKHQTLIPAGFRDAVIAAPRDPALRARMADCEAHDPKTLRRAGHDLALAFLLGANRIVAPERADLLVAAEQPTPSQRAFYFISADELAIEDALTRALYTQHARMGNDRFVGWSQVFVHSCRGVPCIVKDRNAGFGDPDLISWDLRDGGVNSAHDASGDRQQREAQCNAHTGYSFLEECRTGCETTGHGGACLTKCDAFCAPHE